MKTVAEKQNKTVLICLLILALPIACILIELGNIITVSIMNNAFNETRDYVCFRLTHFIMEGINPYSLETVKDLNVPFFCLYGALYPLIVAVICKITGISIVAGYYFANILLVGLTTINVWFIVKESFEEYILAEYRWIVFICVAINTGTFFTMFRLPILNFRGDVVGIYITSVIFLIIYKNKERVYLIAFLTVMLFFAKQIMLFMGVPILVFYILSDKKLAKKYLISGSVWGIGSLVVIQLMFPLYLSETIAALVGTNANYGSLKSSIYNIIFLIKQYGAYCIAILVGSMHYFKIKKIRDVHSLIEILLKKIKSADAIIIYLLMNVAFGTVFLLYFAKGYGDGYKYCQDFLAASIFVLGIFFFNRYCMKFFCYTKKIVGLVVLCVATTITFFQFSINFYSKDDVQAYQDLNEIISEHANELMYLGLNSTQYMLNEDIWESANIYFNDGHAECFMPDLVNEKLSKKLLYDYQIRRVMEDYSNRVNEMVKNKAFGIVTTSGEGVVDMQFLKKNYYEYETYKLKSEALSLDVTVWLPL